MKGNLSELRMIIEKLSQRVAMVQNHEKDRGTNQ